MTHRRWTTAAWAGLALALLSGAAQAASFDCGAARRPAERSICADKALSALDDQLDAAYRAAMAEAVDPPALARGQWVWLGQRDRCSDAACLQRAYRERIAAIGAVPRAGWATYSDPRLGIAFDYLANRRVAPCPSSSGPACVMLVAPGMRRGDYLIEFKLVKGPLEAVARSEAGFEPQDGRWMTTFGRFDPVAVERFAGPGWSGMRATLTCGVDDANGFHAAAGSCLWVVVSNGQRAVVADTEGLVGGDPATWRSVASLRFLP